MHLVQPLPRPDRSVFVGKAVPLPWPQIQLTVSENRLTLAKSYFTGTAKQKNNSKACLSRKLVWKFNKWLFLSQCSHNWWPENGNGCQAEILIQWINCYRSQPGRRTESWKARRRHSSRPTGPSYVTTQTESVWDWGLMVETIPFQVCLMQANWCIALYAHTTS